MVTVLFCTLDEVTKSSKEHPELFMNSKRKCLENDESVTDQINGATREEHELRNEDVIGMSVTEANGEDSEHESINDSVSFFICVFEF